MKAKKIWITYEINGITAVAKHSDQTVFSAVKKMTGSLNSINRKGESTPHARIIMVEVEY